MSSRLARGAASLALAAALCAACEGADVTRVVDASTLVVKGHRISLHGVDAPSASKPKCPAESEAAAAATKRLQAMISGGKDVSFRKTGMACLQFMTCDAFVSVDGVDVSEQLIIDGVVSRRGGEPGQVHDWCALKPPPVAAPVSAAPAAPPDPAPAPVEPPKPN